MIEITNLSDINFQIQHGKLMYAVPLYPFQTLRDRVPSGTKVTFTNCIKAKDQYVETTLW